MNFSVNTEVVEDGLAVITLTGEVDLYTAPEFKKHLHDQIEAGVQTIAIDFSGTTFIDSTTLGVLVGGVKRLRPVGGQVLLICSDRNIIKIFEITGLHRVFDIFATREEALEAARSGVASE